MLQKIDGALLPNSPLGESTQDIVLQYYDGPRLVLQRSRSERLYLSWWSDSDESIDRWIHLPVSESRLYQILSGEMTAHDGLIHPEDGYIYVTDVDAVTGKVVQSLMTDAASLPEDAMPLPGARLNMSLYEIQTALESYKASSFALSTA